MKFSVLLLVAFCPVLQVVDQEAVDELSEACSTKPVVLQGLAHDMMLVCPMHAKLQKLQNIVMRERSRSELLHLTTSYRINHSASPQPPSSCCRTSYGCNGQTRCVFIIYADTLNGLDLPAETIQPLKLSLPSHPGIVCFDVCPGHEMATSC